MKKFFGLIILFIASLISLKTVAAYEVPPLPSNGIYDPHQYLSQESTQAIQSLNSNASQTELKPQIGVVIIDSLGQESIEEVANQFATNWQIGFADTNAGALLLVSIQDRKFRIEVSDVAAQELDASEREYILENHKHYFRSQNYSQGIESMVRDMMTELTGGTASSASFDYQKMSENLRAEHPELYDEAQSNTQSRYRGINYQSSSSRNSSDDSSAILFLGIIFAIVMIPLSLIGGNNRYNNNNYYHNHSFYDNHHSSASSLDSDFSSSSFDTSDSGGSDFSSSDFGSGGGGFSGEGSSDDW